MADLNALEARVDELSAQLAALGSLQKQIMDINARIEGISAGFLPVIARALADVEVYRDAYRYLKSQTQQGQDMPLEST